MSLTATLRPAGLPFAPASSGATYNHVPDSASNVPFHHDPNYLALSRMLIRFQTLILLTPSPAVSPQVYETTPLQRKIQAELWSPLPYHRTKWLHNIEGARNLLLQLERAALGIKVQRSKKEAVKDLAEKRTQIKRLRNRVEEIGREVESMGDKVWEVRRTEDDELLGERVDEVLGKTLRKEIDGKGQQSDFVLQEGKPVTNITEQPDEEADANIQREELFGSSVRRRLGQSGDVESSLSSASKGQTSGYSNIQSTEKVLAESSRTHEDLTTSLVSMAAQLKQQTRAFQFSLDQDKGLLDRAVEGLDLNVTSMQLASKNMAFLTRMSEGEGWWGRMKLYAFIFGMWVAAILLVFVGPKLRF